MTDGTGATAVILSDSGAALTVSGLNVSSGAFTPASTITGTIGLINYGGASVPFQNETIRGTISHANATITSVGTSTLLISNITGGAFSVGETITGSTSGATATIANYSAPASATVGTYTFVSGDQPITLSGGTAYIVTDVVITNASTSLTTANGGNIYSGTDLSGYQIATINNFNSLVSPSNYINNTTGINIGYAGASVSSGGSSSNTIAPFSSSSPIYFSLDIAQGAVATADIYVYGYILY